MGVPSSNTAGVDDATRLESLVSMYDPLSEPLTHVIDFTMYKKKPHIQSAPGQPNQVLVKRYIFRSPEETPRFVELMKTRRSMTPRFIPRLLDFFLKLDNGYCQTFYTYHVVFEYADYNLEKELATRAKNIQTRGPTGQNFMESEVWYMLHSISNALAELQSVGIHHGDVQPCNVMIDESGGVKLLDAMCYDNQKSTGLLRMLQSNFHLSPIAPELMEMYLKRVPVLYNQEKADIYSLGITILCICTISDFRQTYYSFESYKINFDRIAADLSRLPSLGYSPGLAQGLSNMLNPDHNRRFSLNQLNKFIAEHVEM